MTEGGREEGTEGEGGRRREERVSVLDLKGKIYQHK